MINNIIGGVERLETVKTAVRDIRMLGLMQGIFQQVAIVNKFIPVAFFSSVKIAWKNRRRLSRNGLNFFHRQLAPLHAGYYSPLIQLRIEHIKWFSVAFIFKLDPRANPV